MEKDEQPSMELLEPDTTTPDATQAECANQCSDFSEPAVPVREQISDVLKRTDSPLRDGDGIPRFISVSPFVAQMQRNP
jgi:hypothetical protein